MTGLVYGKNHHSVLNITFLFLISELLRRANEYFGSFARRGKFIFRSVKIPDSNPANGGARSAQGYLVVKIAVRKCLESIFRIVFSTLGKPVLAVVEFEIIGLIRRSDNLEASGYTLVFETDNHVAARTDSFESHFIVGGFGVPLFEIRRRKELRTVRFVIMPVFHIEVYVKRGFRPVFDADQQIVSVCFAVVFGQLVQVCFPKNSLVAGILFI